MSEKGMADHPWQENAYQEAVKGSCAFCPRLRSEHPAPGGEASDEDVIHAGLLLGIAPSESRAILAAHAQPPEPRRIGGRTQDEWIEANTAGVGGLFLQLLSAAFSEPYR